METFRKKGEGMRYVFVFHRHDERMDELLDYAIIEADSFEKAEKFGDTYSLFSAGVVVVGLVCYER